MKELMGQHGLINAVLTKIAIGLMIAVLIEIALMFLVGILGIIVTCWKK